MAETVKLENQPEQIQPNLTLLGPLLAQMVREAIQEGRWVVDADGRAHPVDRPAGRVLQFPCPHQDTKEEERHATA